MCNFGGLLESYKVSAEALLTLTNFPAHNLEDINLHPLPEENQFLLQINVVAIIILIINTTTTIMEMATWLFIDTITMSSICQLLYGQNQQVRKLKTRSTNHRCFDTVKRQEFIRKYDNPELVLSCTKIMWLWPSNSFYWSLILSRATTFSSVVSSLSGLFVDFNDQQFIISL